MNQVFRLSFLRYCLLSQLLMKQAKKSLTEGNILKALIALALPVIGTNLLYSGYQLVDAFWVGRLGANAVAAVSISYPVNFLMISLSSGFAFAGSILVAQYAGAKNLKMVNYVATQTLIIVLLMSLVLSGVAYALSPQILHWLGVEQEIFADANLFQRVIFIGLVFNFSFILFQSLLRGIGEVKIPLYINTLTLGLNFLLDPLFIYGWGPIPAYGVAGAAYSTLATLALAAIIGMYILFYGKTDFQLTLKKFKLDIALFKKCFKLGMPSSMEISARALGLTLLTGVAARFGTEVLAAYGVGARLISLVVVVGLALMKANAALVGQNIGAMKMDRAQKTSDYAAIISFTSMTLIGIMFYVFAEPIVRAFLSADDEIIDMGVSFIKITAPSFGFMGMQLALVGTLRGSGNTLESMILTMIGIWGLQFPFAIITSNMDSMGYLGIWWSFPVSYVLPAIITLVWYKTGAWKNKRVIG